jgi:hypothetical protein
MLAEAIAIDIVCASTISDTCKLPTSSLFRFSYNFSAKFVEGRKEVKFYPTQQIIDALKL